MRSAPPLSPSASSPYDPSRPLTPSKSMATRSPPSAAAQPSPKSPLHHSMPADDAGGRSKGHGSIFSLFPSNDRYYYRLSLRDQWC